MAKHLNKRDIDRIVDLLDRWSSPLLTWEILRRACKPILGVKPARQTLYRTKRIYDAYIACKAKLKTTTPTTIKASSNLTQVIQRNERLTVELGLVRRQNMRYKEQFAVWQYNAHNRGMTKEELNRPLPAKTK